MRASLRAVTREALSSQSGSAQDCRALRIRICPEPSLTSPRLDIKPRPFHRHLLLRALNEARGTVIRT